MDVQETTANIDLQVILKSEFPYKAEYLKFNSSINSLGIACLETGEAFVLIDALVDSKYIGELVFGSCQLDCKHVNVSKRTGVNPFTGKGIELEHYSCNLNDDGMLESIVVELVNTMVHEIIHLMVSDSEERVCRASAAIAKPLDRCKKFALNNKNPDGCLCDYMIKKRSRPTRATKSDSGR